jgi:hypothetical protein
MGTGRFRHLGARAGALVTAVATLALAGALGTAGAAGAAPAANPAPASASKTDAKTLAVEVCEDMVRDAVISAIGGPLASPQTGAWKGTRYTCTYPMTGGQLVMRVDTFASHKKARSAYAKAVKAVKIDQKLKGLGEQALLAKNGKVLAEKDLFVLTADPAAIPPKFSKANVSLAAVEAVLSCWTGTGSS